MRPIEMGAKWLPPFAFLALFCPRRRTVLCLLRVDLPVHRLSIRINPFVESPIRFIDSDILSQSIRRMCNVRAWHCIQALTVDTDKPRR